MKNKSLFIEISVSDSCNLSDIPDEKEFNLWINTAWQNINWDLIFFKKANLKKIKTLSLYFCDDSEIQQINKTYRNLDKPTNVLSFSAFDFNCEKINKDLLNIDCLGDLIFCPTIINEQATKKYKKKILEHWAHLSIHGFLHLIGYDHQNDEQAKIMEQTEIDLLQKLGIANPYIY